MLLKVILVLAMHRAFLVYYIRRLIKVYFFVIVHVKPLIFRSFWLF